MSVTIGGRTFVHGGSGCHITASTAIENEQLRLFSRAVGGGKVVVLAKDQPPPKTSVIARFRGRFVVVADVDGPPSCVSCKGGW